MVPRVCQLVAVVDEVAGPEGRAQSVGGFRLEFLKADEEAMLSNLRAFIGEFHTRLALVRCLCVPCRGGATESECSILLDLRICLALCPAGIGVALLRVALELML
jgi:hypothetical protein